MALSYEFSIGSVRAKECSLFGSAEFEQMLGMKSEEELCRFLSDKGYGEGSSADELLESNTQAMWAYIKSVAPDMGIFTPFLQRNDIHNIKAVIKGLMSGKNTESLMADPCTIPRRLLMEAAENRRFDKLPEWIGDAADKAYALLAESGDARLSDGLIDCAYMKELSRAADENGSVFLAEYFRTLIFYTDIKILLRGARTGASRDYFERAVCPIAGLDRKTAIGKALSGESNLVRYLEHIDAYDCRGAAKAYGESPSQFERFVDNKLIALVRKSCRYASEGAEPLLGYYLGCEAERKVIHIIDGGIRTKTPTDKIRERLRDTYG